MKRAKLILLALALPFVLVPTVRANDGHDGEKGKQEHHDNDRHDNDKHDKDGGDHDRSSNGNHHEDSDGTTTHSPNRVPINAGIGILLVAGLGLGAKVMIDRNKKKATVI